MHRLKFVFPSLLVLMLIATSCADKTVKVYMANVPQYTSMEEWRAQPISFGTARALKTPGKIYLYNNLLLVNEFMQGVHFYDNSNPSSPIPLGFLPILANQELAVRNNILYVDSYTDLLSFDISNPQQPHFLSRVNDVFQFEQWYSLPGYDQNYPMVGIDNTQGVVTGWVVEETTQDVQDMRGGGWMMEDVTFNGGVVNTLSTPAMNNVGGPGIGGSTARFAIYDHYLYAVQFWQLGVFDIQEGMVLTEDLILNRMAETLYPTEGYLYIGTTTGMLIYDLSNPGNPSFVSDYSHMTSCDPVVVQGDKAFVTLSTGRTCAGTLNVLEVIDLSNIQVPTLLYQFPMNNPKGLGLDGNTLFLCDGDAGLKVFDKSDLATIDQHLISHFSGITSADVIPHNQVLVMTAAEGIYQYSFADLNHITQLSLIPIQH